MGYVRTRRGAPQIAADAKCRKRRPPASSGAFAVLIRSKRAVSSPGESPWQQSTLEVVVNRHWTGFESLDARRAAQTGLELIDASSG